MMTVGLIAQCVVLAKFINSLVSTFNSMFAESKSVLSKAQFNLHRSMALGDAF
jgi:hypothetical protein